MSAASEPSSHLLRPLVALAAALVCGAFVFGRAERASTRAPKKLGTAHESLVATRAAVRSTVAAAPAGERDSLGDGFPDAVRLARPEDRATFVRWLTLLAEEQYYFPSPKAAAEIHDCAGLIRYAFRNALMVHDSAWRQSILTASAAEAGGEPDFGDVREFTYPHWALGPGLFRTRAGPLAPGDLADGAFAQFADAATLLDYNTFFISRDVRAAEPGDLLFYHQPGQAEAYHSMLFVGRSYFEPQRADWVVYDTGDVNGRPGEIREAEVRLLMQHPDPRWRPLAENPRFLGVYRFELLR